MKLKFLHPKDEIIEIINRIYKNGMTTTSGGNLSILDQDGSIWITPKGIDKGSLTPKDIVQVLPDGEIHGIHEPSSEYPFHKSLYQTRADAKAIVHAHPPALVSFAITHQIPDTRVVPKANQICGNVGYAPYAIPGSQKLGDIISETFSKGFDSVIMENHSIVTIGNSLMHAFQRLETLDFCARLILKANILGKVHVLSGQDLELSRKSFSLPEFTPSIHTSEEKEYRKIICELIHRSYDQKLMTSMEGTFSARIDKNSFIITPYGKDRKYLTPDDLILIQNGKKEAGTKPSRSVQLHAKLYEMNPEMNSIIIAHPPNILAFGVAREKFDTRTIPESYIMLKDIPNLPYGMEFKTQDTSKKGVLSIISKKVPIVICQNNCIIVTANSLLQAFDRLEVAEYSAKSLIASKAIGEIVPIQQQEIEDLEEAFNLSV